jgi:hypothetical protein
MLEETHPDYSFLLLHIEHIVSCEPLFVRYRTVRCASAYGFYRIYSRASEYRLEVPFLVPSVGLYVAARPAACQG